MFPGSQSPVSAVHEPWMWEVGVPGVVRLGGYRWGAIPGTYPAGYIGIARAQSYTLFSRQALERVRLALQAPAGPSAHQAPRGTRLASDGRDSASYILKLVIIPECHRKVLMRPAIVPVLKRGSKCTTLNS